MVVDGEDIMNWKKWNKPGSITVYAMVVFGIVVSLYFMGYTSPLLNSLSQQEVIQGDNGTNYTITTNANPSAVANNLINAIINILLTPKYLGALLVVGLVSFFTAGGTRYGITFIAPALILLVVMNVIVMPIDFIYDSAMPEPIKIFIFSFMNLFLMLSIVEFIGGRD